MAAPDDVSGRGILFVMSKIARPDILSEKKYMEWYEDDHIAEIMETSGIHSARRFVEVNKAGDKPYLATYQLEDLAFLRTEEFRNIKVKSDLLPGSGLIYDLADFDVRNDRLVQVSDPTKKGPGHARSLVTHHLETKAESVSDEQVDSWYREEVCPRMTKAKGYLRTTRFKLVFARSNAESRVLKGLAPPTNDPLPPAARWSTLHEFDCDGKDIDLEELEALTASPMHDQVTGAAALNETRVYELVKEFGKKDWFHGVEM